MAKTIATVGGIAIKPGISRNRRLYSPEMVERAVGRAQKRIAAGDQPMVMLTHHGAEDSSRDIVARLTGMSLAEDGSARFTAALADTPAGHDIASLADTADGAQPHLKGVSIRGYWTGTVRKVKGPDGQPVETADGLDIDGLDFTRSPGVPGAAVDAFAWAGKSGRSETTERVQIFESAEEARVTFTDEAAPALRLDELGALFGLGAHVLEDGICQTCSAVGEAGDAPGDGSKPFGNVAYADPGYQADKKKRYPIDTKAHARAAYAYLSKKANAAKYSAAQLKRVMARIKAACKKFGVTVAAEGWTAGQMVHVGETLAVTEWWPGMPADQAGSYCLDVTNGPTSICISTRCLDPAELDPILRKAADAACQALKALDPDMDGDIDVPGAPDADTDGDQAGESVGDDALLVEYERVTELRAEVAALEAKRAGLAPAAEPGQEDGADKAAREAFAASLAAQHPEDIKTGMRAIERWAAADAYPDTMSAADAQWMWQACAEQLASRNDPAAA